MAKYGQNMSSPSH